MSIISPNNPTAPGGAAKASAAPDPGSHAAGEAKATENRFEAVRNGAARGGRHRGAGRYRACGGATDWTLPKLSSLAGGGANAADWCDQHNVPDSSCIECKPCFGPPTRILAGVLNTESRSVRGSMPKWRK